MVRCRFRTAHKFCVRIRFLLRSIAALVVASVLTSILIGVLGAAPATQAQTSAPQPDATQLPLPRGFGSLNLRMHWDDLQSNRDVIELTRLTSDWERLVYECGYRRAQTSNADARVLITAEDFIVTRLSYVTNIEPGSDLTSVAQTVIDTYGQPQQTSMRDVLGVTTIDSSQATYVTMEFTNEAPTRFVISGDPLWEFRISIDDADMRRAQNRTLRCARAKEKQQRKKPQN